MSIDQFKELVSPDDDDFLYIVDINGGYSGRPRTKKVKTKNLLRNATQSLPSEIRSYANNNNYLILLDEENTYKILYSDFLAGLPASNDSGSSGSGTAWININTNAIIPANSKIVINASSEITLNFPVGLGEIELYNKTNVKVNVNLNTAKYNGKTLESPSLSFVNQYARYLYLDNSIGWIPLNGSIRGLSFGNPLLQIQGSFEDLSAYNRPVTVLGSPAIVTGVDSNPVIRFNGATGQEVNTPYFLSGTTGASLYCVFTVSSGSSYNLVQTSALDDYWRFINNGYGYFGTFRNARIENYPTGMPGSGTHLIAIHANSNGYEVLLDNVSKGFRSEVYVSGNKFSIGVNGKFFDGDIGLVLVYPWHSPSSSDALSIVNKVKETFPSLPFTL